MRAIYKMKRLSFVTDPFIVISVPREYIVIRFDL